MCAKISRILKEVRTLKNLDLKNKIIFASFFMTTTFIFVFGFIYFLLDLSSNHKAAISIGFTLLIATNFLFSKLVYELLVKDILNIKNKIENFKGGKINETFHSKRNDEIGEIYRGLESMSNSHKNIMRRVQKNSEKIEQSSNDVKLLIIENKDIVTELSKNIVLVNTGTASQMRGIEDVEFSIEEMAMGIERINTTVNDVARNANNSVIEAKKGNSALEKVVMKMNDIQKNSEMSMKTIRVLGEKIKEIQEIVDVIRSVSSRTNLLALNATIEAERAGENGEGFIVVAEEIKDLAIKSTASTVKIEKITRNIVERQEKAIEQIEKNNQNIMEGITVVNGANQAFNKILIATGDIENQLNEVSSSSEQLNTNTKEILESVERTSKISKEFSKNTTNIEAFVEQQENSIEKLIKTIEELNDMTNEINDFVINYKK